MNDDICMTYKWATNINNAFIFDEKLTFKKTNYETYP